MIAEAILKLKEGKACGPSGIGIEMIKWGGDELLNIIVDLMNLIIKEDRIPEDWNQSTIINCFKGKGMQLPVETIVV